MLMPSVFGKDLFDDFFDFPFYDNNEMDKLEKKLYGHRGKNLMKQMFRNLMTVTLWKWICRDFLRTRLRFLLKMVI